MRAHACDGPTAEQHIRLYATKHLGQLIRDTPKANEWTLRLLLTQLYDPSIQVAELAVHFLEDVCDGADILELVVKMQPTLDHLGDIGHPLLLKYVDCSICLVDRANHCKLGSCRHPWVFDTCIIRSTSIVRWIAGSMYDLFLLALLTFHNLSALQPGTQLSLCCSSGNFLG